MAVRFFLCCCHRLPHTHTHHGIYVVRFFFFPLFQKHWKFLTFFSSLSHANSPSLSEGGIKNYQTYVSTQQIMMKVAFGTAKLYMCAGCTAVYAFGGFLFLRRRRKTEVQKKLCVCLGDELDFCLQFFFLYLCVYGIFLFHIFFVGSLQPLPIIANWWIINLLWKTCAAQRET